MNMDGPDLAIDSSAEILSSTVQQQCEAGQKRSKLMKSPSQKQARKAEAGAPKITRPCSECGKTFWSWKALFGHMRCHPERQWRGINPPPNHNHDFTMLTVEDHQVAQSLLLLANGSGAILDPRPPTRVNIVEVEEERNINLIPGNNKFECSSCKKVFGSHQALGGHRASHKNVKGCFAITRSTESEVDDHHQGLRSSSMSHDQDYPSSHSHTCSICLRVFSSGQALGGHKRCHWEEPSVNHGYGYGYGYGRERSGFDLNLPPQPEDDHTTVTSSGSNYSSGLTLDLRLGL